jgi:hypothetical protein
MLSAVRLRQQVLKDLDVYARALELEHQTGVPAIDSVSLWNGTQKVDTLRAPRAGALTEKELFG